MSINVFSQLGGVHDYRDTAYIAPRKMAQEQSFLDNKDGFPAKPRNKWQLGFYLGFPHIDGDCPAVLRGAGSGIGSYSYGFGAEARKAIGYTVSARLSFSYYHMMGLDYKPNSNINNSRVIQALYATAPRGYVHNYKTQALAPALEMLISINNIMFHKKQQRWNFYGLIGYVGLIYNAQMDVMDANGAAYPFENIALQYNNGASASDLRKMLRDMLDGDYETRADAKNARVNSGKKWLLENSFSAGFGFEYRMGKNWSINVEYKRIYTRNDYIDGWYRQSGDLRYAVFTSKDDNVGFGRFGVGFNIGNSKKRVAPLWWLNPLAFAYNDLAKDRAAIAKISKLKDDDKDGVINEMDLEPNTPEGCPVDTHGVTADTDGDGVPDCKDKEKLTQQKCFPVDADGVGNCPESSCCDSARNGYYNGYGPGGPGGYGSGGSDSTGGYNNGKNGYNGGRNGGNNGRGGTCQIGDLPTIQFKPNNFQLTKDAQAILSVVADKIKNNPGCNVRVIGFGMSDKKAQQLSWERVNAVIRYLVEEEGISESRLIFEYGKTGDALSVDLTGTVDSGPNTVPAPHPQLRSVKKAGKYQ